MFLAIEAGLTVLALALAFTVPKLGSRWFEALERNLGSLARQRGLSVITVGLTALSLRAALLPILPIPVPGFNDEDAYLLLADTFAHGRLTNPTHPMWVHFETFQVIWQPTHTAKYWPAQGLFMAAGQVLMGHPFWGVWLSVGLMCAAITWMLQAWVGDRVGAAGRVSGGDSPWKLQLLGQQLYGRGGGGDWRGAGAGSVAENEAAASSAERSADGTWFCYHRQQPAL